MENLNLLEELFDDKKLRVIKLFLQNKEKQFYLREISKQTKVPVASTFRIVKKLMELEIIKQIKVNKFKLYKTADNDNVAFLETFLREGKRLVQLFVERAKELSGIKSIILHGEETEEKANLLLIGTNIDSNEVKRICAEIKEQYNFTISPLTLTQEQFTQMSNMGLYSGKKTVLFEK